MAQQRDNLIGGLTPDDFACLKALEEKSLWLSSWMIHHANHIRPNRDGLKVGGHQASSASLVTLMTALYFNELHPNDRVAVKPHASPVFHSIQYLMGRQSLDQLKLFRSFGGAQAYPSRTKDSDQVDFSTGSVGLGVAVTLFASLIQDYLNTKSMLPSGEKPGRMIALMGDAELDEGNVWEAMLEGWKHEVRNLWWIIDYNRQSLDSTVSDKLFNRFDDIFNTTGWNVITLKYGKKLSALADKNGGDAIIQWIDDCPNSLYSALTYKGGEGFRQHIEGEVGNISGVKSLLQDYDNEEFYDLVTDLAGHDMESVLEAFSEADPERPNVFIAYTVKGRGMPFAGHKDNHAGLMTQDQMKQFREKMNIPEGKEWEMYSGTSQGEKRLRDFVKRAPFLKNLDRIRTVAKIAVPKDFPKPKVEQLCFFEEVKINQNDKIRNLDDFDNWLNTTPRKTVARQTSDTFGD